MTKRDSFLSFSVPVRSCANHRWAQRAHLSLGVGDLLTFQSLIALAPAISKTDFQFFRQEPNVRETLNIAVFGRTFTRLFFHVQVMSSELLS